MREGRGAYRVSLGKSEGKKPLGRPDTHVRRLLELILKKWVVGVHWNDLWVCTGMICGRALA